MAHSQSPYKCEHTPDHSRKQEARESPGQGAEHTRAPPRPRHGAAEDAWLTPKQTVRPWG